MNPPCDCKKCHKHGKNSKVPGNLEVCKNLTVHGDSNFQSVTVEKDLTVKGNTNLQSVTIQAGISANEICLTTQNESPACDNGAQGCLWVGTSNAKIAAKSPYELPIIYTFTGPIAAGQTIDVPFAILNTNNTNLVVTVSWPSISTDIDLIVYDAKDKFAGDSQTLANPEIVRIDLTTLPADAVIGNWRAKIISYAGPATTYTLIVRLGNSIPDKLHYQDNQCNDYIVDTTATDPLNGFWVMVLAGGSSWDDSFTNVTAMSIDTTKTPIETYAYTGPLDALRELAPYEGQKISYFNRVNASTIRKVGSGGPADTFDVVFTLQADKTTLAGFVLKGINSSMGYSYSLSYKTPRPHIRPFGHSEYDFNDGTSSKDVNNPVFMFDEFCDLNLTRQPMTNPRMGYVQYPGYLAFRELQQKLKTTGVTYTTAITRIQRTVYDPTLGYWTATKQQLSPQRAITTFVCNGITHVNPMSRVVISGLTGPAAKMNGEHNVLLTGNVLFSDNDSNFMNPATREYRFNIEFDSHTFPADNLGYLTGLTGREQVTVTILPVTGGTEYRQLLDAEYEMFYSMFQFSTHSKLQYYRPFSGTGDQLHIIPTYAELQERIRDETARFSVFLLRNFLCGTSMYNNLSFNQFPRDVPNTQEPEYLNPFGINAPSLSSIFAYNIALNNYLDHTPGFEPANIWWRLTGKPVTPLQQAAGLAYYGDPDLGQTFEAIMWPISAGVPPPAGTGAEYFQLGNDTVNNFDQFYAERYIFARLNPVFTGGLNIGYIRLMEYYWRDPLFYMFDRDFAPAPPAFPIDTRVNNPRANVEAACRVWATGTTYVKTTLGCGNRMEYDHRQNNGGSPIQNLICASFMGGDRQAGEFSDKRVDVGFSPILQAPNQNMGSFIIEGNNLNLSMQPATVILPSKSELYYPGSVWNAAGSRVYILTDINSASGGDEFPHFFLGDNLDKNIGAGVTAKIFGDLNGILCGGTGGGINQTTSSIFIVTDNDGLPVPFNSHIYESSNFFLNKMKVEPFSLNNRVPTLKPDTPLPAVNYLGAGPWPNRWQDNAYNDIGAQPYGLPPGLRLPGDKRPNPVTLPKWPAAPAPEDRLLWRDCWLEQTTLDAMQP